MVGHPFERILPTKLIDVGMLTLSLHTQLANEYQPSQQHRFSFAIRLLPLRTMVGE
jgi:hypothetical protein